MASMKHVHSMTSSVTYPRAHKKNPIRRRRRSTYSTSSEEMGDTTQSADPRTVREGCLRYYREAEERRRREERERAAEEHRKNSNAKRLRDDKSSNRTRSRESHSHRRSSNSRDNKVSSTYDNEKGKRQQDLPERVIIRRTVVEEPRGSFIGGHLKELRSPPVARRTSTRDPEAGSSRKGTEYGNAERSASVQERSDINVRVAAGIAESVRRRGTTATRDRPAGRTSPRSPGKGRLVVEEASATAVATPSIAPSVTTRTTTDTKRRASKPPPSVLGTIFGAPTPVAKQPEALVTCLACADDETPRSKAAKLACSHYMCHDCLKRLFTMSVTDPAHMPPKCCKADHIPLKHVEKLFDNKFKVKWNKKYQEYTTKNRLYCPVRGCGEWIKPASITTDSHGRKYGKCGRCKTKVCATCNGKYHISKDCPKDEATKAFAEIAKKEGWRRCTNCTAMIERKSGCNHIICRCRAEFCILCGSKWKTCNCPQFNDEVIAQMREEEMRNPFGFVIPEELGHHPEAGIPFREQVRRQQERERREQERQDADMAQRLGAMDFLDPGQDPAADMGVLGAALADALARPLRPVERPRQPPTHVRPPMGNRGYPGPPRRRYATGGTERHASDYESQGSRSRGTRAERVVVRREARDYRTEVETHRPITVRGSHADLRSSRGTRARRSAAVMAGLDKKSTQGRVGEWVKHIEDGEGPESDEEWEEDF